MTKKEYCLANPAIAYCDALSGLEIYGVEYGVNDFLYCVSGIRGGNKSYHRLKINHDNDDDCFVRLMGCKIRMSECLRI
ncbi:MAG: hypothetical protein RR415_06075 [Ruthenibacterium sp.]